MCLAQDSQPARSGPRFLPLAFALVVALVGCKDRRKPDSGSTSSTRAGSELRVIDLDPAEDRERSPWTGWTRGHYEAVFARLLLGFVDHRSPAGGRSRYAGGESMPAAMEGATRMLPALGAWLACPCNPNRISVEGRELDVAEIAKTILVAGTDPASRDYWHPIARGWDQRKVEAALVAEFLLRSRARVWERLDVIERARVIEWLRDERQLLAANWVALDLARNLARRELGLSVSDEAMDEELDAIEGAHVGDGFYRDGHAHRIDWYNAFVIHHQLSLWRELAGEDQPERARRLEARTRAFVGHMPYLMDARGRVAPIGRSLAYRFAVLAAVQASVLADDEWLDPGLARRMSSANLRSHLEGGMFDESSVLTRGYHGDEPGVCERYLRPGSQYFATRGLQVLALPPEHPFWTAREQPLPADLGDFDHAIAGPGWMATHEDGVLTLHNAGTSSRKRSYYARYGKLAYSPTAWFASAREGSDERPYDSLVISAAEGGFTERRSASRGDATAPGFAWTRYLMAPEGVDRHHPDYAPHAISTAALTAGSPDLRLTCVTPSPLRGARPYEGSFALVDAGEASRADPEGRWHYLEAPGSGPGSGSLWFASLVGWERLGLALDLDEPVSHVLAPKSGGTFVGASIPTELDEPRCFASAWRLAEDPFDPEGELERAPTVSFEGSSARVSWSEGAQAFVELGLAALERELELASVRARGPLRMLEVREHEGQIRVVAEGLRELEVEGVPMLRSAEPRRGLECRRSAGRIRCRIDGPVQLARPGSGELIVRVATPGWSGGEPKWRVEDRLDAAESIWLTLDPKHPKWGLSAAREANSHFIVELVAAGS